MADTTRAAFPDPDRPLYTPDEDAQRLVAERIRQGKGKRGQRRRHPMTYTDESGTVHVGTYAPKGQHPYVSDTDIGEAWGLGQTRANELVKHPESLDPFQVTTLCDLLGVTLEWLRGWTDENAYGRYEPTELVATMYEHLGAEDKVHLCYLLTKLLGDEQAQSVKMEWQRKQHAEWWERHPDEQRRLEEMRSSFMAQLTASFEPLKLVGEDMAAEFTAAVREPLKRAAEAAAASLAQLTDEERARLQQALEDSGEGADQMQANGSFVETDEHHQ